MGSMNTLLLVVFITTLAGSVTLAAPERQQNRRHSVRPPRHAQKRFERRFGRNKVVPGERGPDVERKP